MVSVLECIFPNMVSTAKPDGHFSFLGVDRKSKCKMVSSVSTDYQVDDGQCEKVESCVVHTLPAEPWLLAESPGARRDRTRQWTEARRRFLEQRPRSRSRASSSSVDHEQPTASLAEQTMVVADMYKQSARAQNDLASMLALHNGFRQFGVEFAGRVPPLELRQKLAELEERIPQRITELFQLVMQLDASHEHSATETDLEVRANLRLHMEQAANRMSVAFEMQQAQIQVQAANSPLTSPVLPALIDHRLLLKRFPASELTTCSLASCKPQLVQTSTSTAVVECHAGNEGECLLM